MVRTPKVYVKQPTAALSKSQVKKILNSFRDSLHSTPMHRAILATGFYTGLRSFEIRNIRIQDFGIVDGLKVLQVIAKGQKSREVPITEELDIYLRAYELQRDDWGLDDPGCFYFVSSKSKSNKILHPESLRQIFLNSLKQAGIEKSELRRYSPHSMRATAITHMLSSLKLPIERVQEAVGHSSIATTKLYDKTGNDPHNSVLLDISY